MADNANKPGFRFLRMRNGADRPVIELRDVASGQTAGIFIGDPLMVQATGTYPGSVEPAIAAQPVFGIADGVEQYLEGGVLRRGNYLPASTTWSLNEQRSVVRVILARDAVFEIQGTKAAAAAPLTRAAWDAIVNTNCNHVVGTGVTASGKGAFVLNLGSSASTTAQWRVVGYDRSQDVTGANFKVQVEVNHSFEPQFLAATNA
jgi:hypothetical protein